MLIGFHLTHPVMAPILNKGTVLRTGSQYKSLGTVLDDKLTINTNLDYICKKSNQRLLVLFDEVEGVKLTD